MASMTIRNLDDRLKTKLRMRAAAHGRSMEEEARDILRSALATTGHEEENLASAIRRRVEPIGGIDMELPQRSPRREPVDFGE